VRGNLKNNSDDVDEATDDDSPATTNGISNITSDDSSEEGTGRENGSDERVVGTRESLYARTLNELDEDGRTSDTVDVTYNQKVRSRRTSIILRYDCLPESYPKKIPPKEAKAQIR
jgi:hypothetical protein